MIISASRRTDIPSYYSEWFLNRLRAGYVLTRNPMNYSQVSRIRLSPEVIDCIVFWTKDPYPMMDKLPLLDQMGYRYYFQFTLTPYGRDMEHNLRDKNDILKTFRKLSETIGRERVLWRYDPVILNDNLTISYHQEKLEYLCSQLKDCTEVCTISFVDLYRKLKKRNDPSNAAHIREIAEEEMGRLAAAFAEAGRRHGITIKSCCEQMDLRGYGIYPGSCIDKAAIDKICGYSIDSRADTSQRPGCGCIQSIDIGVYNTCKNGCSYCYANYSENSVTRNYLSHNPESEILIGTVKEADRVTDREMKLLRSGQRKLFDS